MTDAETSQDNERKAPRWRTYLAFALAVLFAISLVAANHAAWLVTTVLDTESFVDALAPIPRDPEVASALGQGIANSITESSEVGQRIAEVLPEGLAFLAVPVTEGLSDAIATIATNIVQSDAFSTVWQAALTVAHATALLFVDGADVGVISSENGVVTLDLTGVAAPIFEQLDTLGFDVLEGTTPDLTIELMEVESQGTIQTIVRLINSIRWFVLGLTVILVIGVFVAATDKKRATVWVGTATAGAMLFSIIDIRYLKSAVASGITDPVDLAGVNATLDIVFSRFVLQSWIVFGLGLFIALTGWLMSDSERALAVRSIFTGEGDESDPSGSAEFVFSHKRLLEWGAVGVVALVLLVAPSASPGVVVFVGAALLVFIVGVEFIASKFEQSVATSDSDSVV